MNRWRRLLFYLGLNVLVSACTILTILYFWNRSNPFQLVTPEPLSLAGLISPTPEAPGTPTPEQTPTLPLDVYVVQSGDTLGSIAAAFGVSVDLLMRLNGLSDPNALGSGQLLLVPVTPIPTLTPTPDPTQEAESVLAATNAASEEIRLVITKVVAAGVLQDERVEIRSEGNAELLLSGWRLEDNQGSIFVFPQLTLFPGGTVAVYSKAGTNSAVELYWGLSDTVWEVGETVILRDPAMNIQASYQIP